MDYALFGLLCLLLFFKLVPDKPRDVIGMKLTSKSSRYFDP
jgi:hypothetical protein